MNTTLRKVAKNDSEKSFSSRWIIKFLEKLRKMFKNTGTLNLQQ